MKRYTDQNVYEAANARLQRIFREFDNVYVSFSGGKDSGILLNLCINIIRRDYPGRRLPVFHMDYEAQYEATTAYVDRVLAEHADIIEPYRVCVPFKVTTCTSMYEDHWRPWENDKRDIWVRDMPPDAITREAFPFFRDDMWDYDFQVEFSRWLHHHKNASRTVCLVGIRTQESLNRWRTIQSDRNRKTYDGLRWTTFIAEDVYNAYPIYDWLTTDVWTANGRNRWDYNRLYDLYYQAGVPIEAMRVASPFLSAAQDSLKLYKVIEPHTWGKLVSRVNGVNFTGIYGGTTAMGWKSITLPPGHTWESYMYFLLGTLPDAVRKNYLLKLRTSIEFWREKGGCLSDDTIAELRDAGVAITVKDMTNYNTDKRPVCMEYVDDINIREFSLIPSYKRMCICIMKNDHLCKYMGFSLTKGEHERRRAIMEKYNAIL